MIGRAINFIIEFDWTALYAVIVWIGVLLAVAWVILMEKDPANEHLPVWELRFRRFGIYVMVGGFLLSVLFAGNQGWTPWPPMLVIAFGFDAFLGAAILSTVHRTKLYASLKVDAAPPRIAARR